MVKEAIASVSEEFVPFLDKKKEYWFFRGPQDLFRDFIVIQSSQKFSCFSVDVAVTAFPVWDNSYGHHQMRSATGLPNLRLGSLAIPAREDIYQHDGSLEGANVILHRIAKEVRILALPWFEDFRRKAKEDEILQFGLHWLEAHQEEIPFDIASQIETALVASRFRRDRVQHSLVSKLESELRAHATNIGASKWQRRETSVLALDLLTYAGHKFARRKASGGP